MRKQAPLENRAAGLFRKPKSSSRTTCAIPSPTQKHRRFRHYRHYSRRIGLLRLTDNVIVILFVPIRLLNPDNNAAVKFGPVPGPVRSGLVRSGGFQNAEVVRAPINSSLETPQKTGSLVDLPWPC